MRHITHGEKSHQLLHRSRLEHCSIVPMHGHRNPAHGENLTNEPHCQHSGCPSNYVKHLYHSEDNCHNSIDLQPVSGEQSYRLSGLIILPPPVWPHHSIIISPVLWFCYRQSGLDMLLSSIWPLCWTVVLNFDRN
jgi:hypothetical protein